METGTPKRPGALTMATFGVATLIGSANFIGVRYSNRELPPFYGAALRFTVAGLLFTVLARALRLRAPRGRVLVDTVLYGALGFALSYALMYWALVRVSAGAATIVLASVPLTTLLLAGAQRLEPLRARNALGAVLALAGIAVMSLDPSQTRIPLDALAAMVGAAVVIGQSMILSKRVAANHPAMTNAVGMTVGGALLFALSFSAGETWALPRQGVSLWALAYLVTIGSMGLFALVLLVVRRWTASASSYMFVLFPVVTLLLGAAFADEAITAGAVAGALLVMTGVWFGALSPSARAAAAASPADSATAPGAAQPGDVAPAPRPNQAS